MNLCPNCFRELNIDYAPSNKITYWCQACSFECHKSAYELFESKIEQKTLTEMLKFLSAYKYECYGFPMFFLTFNQSDKTWSATFRDPRDFDNPETASATPEEACKKLILFIQK